MKTNKEQVYEFIQLYCSAKGDEGVSTQYLSDALGIQRTNVSALLGQLVKEGCLKKSNGRPVLYYVSTKQGTEEGPFKNIIGFNGSLRRSVRLAKAVIAYPQKGLSTILIGHKGTGKNLFANTMYLAAKEENTLIPEAPYIECDCSDYTNGEEALQAILGTGDYPGAYQKATSGILYLDNIHLLTLQIRKKVLSFIQKEEEDSPDKAMPMIILSCDEAYYDVVSALEKYAPITIHLPTLEERPEKERFELLQKFINLEAVRINRTIQMEAELLICLLLFECEKNIWTLKMQLKSACMSAYLREHNDMEGVLHLYVSDFDALVRKGFLKYRLRKNEIIEIVQTNVEYLFDGKTLELNELDREKLKKNTIYEDFDKRIQDYYSEGFDVKEIQTILNADFEALVQNQYRDMPFDVVNREQLEKLVSGQLIELTEGFLRETGRTMGVHYNTSIIYGLCLQLEEMIKGIRIPNKISQEQITRIIGENNIAYSLAVHYTKKLSEAFHVNFTTDEIAIITLFLSQTKAEPKERRGPSILYAFHGIGIAQAIATSIESTMKNGNVFYIDIPLEQSDEETYEQLKDTIQKIDPRNGILVIYDIELLRQILYTLSIDLGTEIRMIQLPLLKMGINWSRYAAVTSDLDSIFKISVDEINSLSVGIRQVIVTVCTTSEGLALRMKEYLEQHHAAEGKEIIALCLSDINLLRENILRIMKDAVIECVIGTYDPGILSIPFIPASEVFATPIERLPDLLSMLRPEQKNVDMDEMYQYLEEHLEYVEVWRMRDLLEEIIQRLKKKYNFYQDIEIGLFMHIACALNRMAGKGISTLNPKREQIINLYGEDYKYLRKLLQPMEKKFHIIFPDDEFANIITIIKRL